MTESFRKAQEASAFLKLVHRSVLLYGRKSVQYVQTTPGQSKRMDFEMKTIGTSMEMPRLENIDSFGLEYTLLVMRAEQRRA